MCCLHQYGTYPNTHHSKIHIPICAKTEPETIYHNFFREYGLEKKKKRLNINTPIMFIKWQKQQNLHLFVVPVATWCRVLQVEPKASFPGAV